MMGASRELAELASVVTVSSGNVGIGTSSPVAKLDVNGSINGTITSGTAVTALGTSIDFTGIPATAKRITVMFDGVSLSGTDSFLIQIGDSGGLETTGYSGGGTRLGGTAVNGTHYTTGFGFNNTTAAQGFSGAITLSNITGNTWAASGVIAAAATESNCLTAGAKTLTGALDRVSVTRTGTNTFDAGTINIMWEA